MFETANIVDSDYYKTIKREFNSLQVLFDKIIKIREINGRIKFVVPLSALIDYKGVRVRATTLTFSKGKGVVWGFNKIGRMIYDDVVDREHLDALSHMLNLHDGQVKRYDLNENLARESQNIVHAPKYAYKLSPSLKIYLNYNMSLEHFQNSNLRGGIKNSQAARDAIKKDGEILYIKNIGDINPPDCNFYYNPRINMIRNLDFIEKNQSNWDYLEMAKDMTIHEKYIYRLSS